MAISIRHTKHILRIFLNSVLVFLGICALSLAGIAYAYKDSYYPGTKVAGENLTGVNQTEAQTLLKNKVQSYLDHPVVLTLPDISQPVDSITGSYPNLEIKTKASELGLEISSDSQLAAAWGVGHQKNILSWSSSALNSLFKGNQFYLNFQINRTKLDAYVHTTIAPKIVSPTPAALHIDGENITISDEKPGLQVDEAALSKLLARELESIEQVKTSVLAAPAQVVAATLTKDKVQPLADQLQKITTTKIDFTADNFDQSPSKTEVLKWYAPIQDASDNLSLVLQKDKLSDTLKAYAGLDQDKSLASSSTTLQNLLVSAGDSTQIMPVKTTVAVSLKPINKPTEAPAVLADYTPGKFEGKYVEVNLAEQRMYLVIGPDLVKSYIISSGAWATPTPKGIFSIHGKTAKAWSAAFGLYMPYWQDFLNGEYGLHELPEWPNGYKEGQNHLGTPVSHGCVRLGVGDAKEVYDWTEIGTPVYIH